MFSSQWGWNIVLKYFMTERSLDVYHPMLLTGKWVSSVTCAVSLTSCPTPYTGRRESWKQSSAMVLGLSVPQTANLLVLLLRNILPIRTETKRVWNESPLRTHMASQKDHYEETEVRADLHVERRINALWDIIESGKASFPCQAKTYGNDFINILFMQSIQQHMQDMVRNAGLLLRSVLWKIISLCPFKTIRTVSRLAVSFCCYLKASHSGSSFISQRTFRFTNCFSKDQFAPEQNC